MVLTMLLFAGCGTGSLPSRAVAVTSHAVTPVAATISAATSSVATVQPTIDSAFSLTMPATSANGPRSAPAAATVAGRLQSAGLPVADISVLTATSDPDHLLGKPDEYASKATFHDTRLPAAGGVDGGGAIEAFADGTTLLTRKAYLQDISKASALFKERDLNAGLVLLRLSATLTPDQAAAYERALSDAAK